MPPHARSHRPSTRCFISGGQGEWSVATKSITPSASARHSASRFAASRIGGAHLNCVAPSAISSAANHRYCVHVSTVIGTPRAARCRQHRQCLGACQVHDVNRRLKLFCEPNQHRDRLQFRRVGPRSEIRRILAPVRACLVERLRCSIHRPRHFSVRQQRQVRAAQLFEGLAQIAFIHPGKSINPGVNQKTLEARHARGHERRNLIGVAAHHAAPRCPVHPSLARSSRSAWLREPRASWSPECSSAACLRA